MMQMNRKTATKLLMVQWSRFQRLCVNLEGSTLFTGVNGSGKSTILDAMTYLLTGNRQFNKAAKDRDRTVLAYVRGDTKSNGPARYLRSGEVISYIAMEFWSPVENQFLVAGVCIESANETAQKSSWFICRNAKIEEINFTKTEGKFLKISPKNELSVKGQPMKSSDFWNRDRGIEQILRALGLRCDVEKYRSKLLKMMAFDPQNNIDQFIQECVLEPGKVESLKELREQRQRFEQIKEVYENLQKSKEKLEEVEQKSTEYEKKKRALHIRELMFAYQELRQKEEEEKETALCMEALKQKLARLRQQKSGLEKRYDDAGERYRIARSNDMVKGMQESLDALERQRKGLEQEIRQNEEKLAKLKHLQLKLLELLPWLEGFLTLTQEDRACLGQLAEDSFLTDRKVDAFVRLADMVGVQDRLFATDEVHFDDQLEKLEEEIRESEQKIKQLKANILVFPREIEDARRLIQKELESEGIRAEVKIFAELVQEVRDEAWRGAIETFLRRKRFHLIVEGKYCHRALKILQKHRLYAANVVITDKLPDTKITPGSAAEILTIPNPNARRFANFLLNGIHLCASLEELHEHPKGGLTKDGMLAKGYSFSCMEMKKTEFCLGQDAIKFQLEKALEEKQNLERERQKIQKDRERICACRKALSQVDWKAEHYDFGAAAALNEVAAQSRKIAEKIDEIRKNPDFMAVLKEQEDAEREYQRLGAEKESLAADIRGCEKDQERKQEEQKILSGEIYRQKREYEELCLQHLEMEKPMMEEYARLKARAEEKRRDKAEESTEGKARESAEGKAGERSGESKACWQVITPKAIRALKNELESCARQLEDVQLAYCRLAEIDVNKRGTAYISFFREEYRNIANVKVEETKRRLDEQSAKLENAFMNDFVAEMNETICDAKSEISAINRELKQLPFGKDTYKFVMKEKPDRAVFFSICRRLEDYMSTPEVYMNSAREDEEMERDIREFMEVILDEEDEQEYTDYRKYFVYDMEIVSRQGDSEVVSDLSKKQGSASNGEKQTPYFIILAASLLQCYPRQTCCARLAFIDEAFSALSRERIEQMVKYLEDNHFQVFYAAPPEKINSIGTYIDSTVSLVITGRYTNAVEGLVR